MSKKAIKSFYESFGVAKQNKKHLKNELLYQLYQKPKKDKGGEIPHIVSGKEDAIHQADLLFLPNDDGYKYALVVVDVATGDTDAEPIKNKTPKDVMNAIKNIYERKYLNVPSFELVVDSGNEFLGVFKEYFKKRGVYVKRAEPNRHRQVGKVEARNKIIGKAIHLRQTAQELQTGEVSREWTEFLPRIIKAINIKLSHKVEKPKFGLPPTGTHEILKRGTKIRVALDAPKDVVSGKRLYGKFRESDIRWDTTIRTVISPLIMENQPIMYKISGKDHVAYTRNQLQLVNDNEQKPPDSMSKKFVVEMILEKKKIKNKIHYLVKWKNYGDQYNTYEPLTDLSIDVPEIVKKYESENK